MMVNTFVVVNRARLFVPAMMADSETMQMAMFANKQRSGLVVMLSRYPDIRK